MRQLRGLMIAVVAAAALIAAIRGVGGPTGAPGTPDGASLPQPSRDRWTQVNGPNGGWITDLEKAGDQLLAATSFTHFGGNGAYRVTDNGRTWEALGGTKARMLDIAVDPGDPLNIAFAADGLSITWNGGEDWERVNLDAEISAVAMSHANSSLVLAGAMARGRGFLFISRDDGRTWSRSKPLPDTPWSVRPIWAGFTDASRHRIQVVEAHPTDQDVVFVGTNSALLRTEDGGRSWTRADSEFHRSDVLDIAVDPADPERVWARVGVFEERTCMEVAGMEDRARAERIERERCAGVYLSGDRGHAWRRLDASYFDPSEGGIFIDDHDPKIAYAVFSRKILKTEDGGLTWKPFFWTHDEPLVANVGVESMAVEGDEVFIAGRQGLWRSGDGGEHWEERNRGFIGSEVVDIVRAADGTLYAGTYSLGMFRSADGGRSWTFASYRLENPYVMLIAAHPTDPRTLFVTTNGGVYASHDGARTWQRVAEDFFGESELLPGVAHFHGIAFDPRDPRRIYVGGGGDQWSPNGAGLSVSEDGGRSWRHVNVGFETNVHVSKIVVDPRRPAVVYVTTQGPTNFNEKTDSGHGVFRSDDYGKTWRTVNVGLGTVETNTLALGAPGVLFLGTDDDGVYRSPDGGESWTRLSIPQLPPRFGVGDIVIDPRDGAIYVATVDYFRLSAARGLVGDHGVFVSRDGGQTWETFSEGLEHAGAFSLELDEASGTLFVGTRGGGVYWRRVPSRP